MNELSDKNKKTIAESLSKQVRLLEERNALQAFSLVYCVTEMGKVERAEFLSLNRSVPLRRPREQLEISATTAETPASAGLRLSTIPASKLGSTVQPLIPIEFPENTPIPLSSLPPGV